MLGVTSDTQFVDASLQARAFYYVIAEAPATPLDLLVWDFDRQVINNAKVRVISGADSSDYVTTDGHLHVQVEPVDSVTVRAWRNTPSQWGNDTLSSYIRTKKIPAVADRVDSMQVQTWDVCDSMDVSPPVYKAWLNKAACKSINIGGNLVRVFGGVNRATMNTDTLWYGKVNIATGDTITDSQQDSLQSIAEELKETQLFTDSPYPNYYQATLTDQEPFISGYGPSRQNLFLWYAGGPSCGIGLYRDIPNDASTTRALVGIAYNLPIGCTRQELVTNLFCTTGAPDTTGVTAMSGKSVVYESNPTDYYTFADKEMCRIQSQIPVNTPRDNILGLP